MVVASGAGSAFTCVYAMKKEGCPHEDGLEHQLHHASHLLAQQAHDALVDGAADVTQLRIRPRAFSHDGRAVQQRRDARGKAAEAVGAHHDLLLAAQRLRVSTPCHAYHEKDLVDEAVDLFGEPGEANAERGLISVTGE